MTCGATSGLIAYSTLVTVILVIISILYSKCGSGNELTACKTGGNFQENVDILSLDLSEKEVGTDFKCDTFTYIGFKTFEMIILSLLLISGIIGLIKLCYNWKNIQAKWKAGKAESQARKFRKWQEQEASTSTVKAVKEEVKPKVETKREAIFKYEAEDN